MKKINKKDLLYCTILAISFIFLAIIVTKGKFIYGSTLDWEAQHISVSEYFRTLFYENHDLFPDFALNLGNGQNIYNFSYYGLLNPIILISYLFPFISMQNYIIISSIIGAIVSSILLYFWLRKNNNELVSFLSSFIFLFTSTMTFHAHRHVMFTNYMPFLIMGLYGVDKKLDQNKGWLLSLSIFLMILTSYYFSISGIFCLFLYGVYKYLKKHNKITFKKAFIDTCSFALPIIIAVLSSMIITLPTLNVILNSRGTGVNQLSLKSIFLPSINTKFYLYSTYGLGLTSIIIFAIINLFNRKKEDKLLGFSFLILFFLPIFNYILNGTMYINEKAFIPLIPLAIFIISKLINDLFDKKYSLKTLLPFTILISILIVIKGKYYDIYLLDALIMLISILLFHKFNKKLILIIPLLLIPFGVSYYYSTSDKLVLKSDREYVNKNMQEVIDFITERDKSFYRISNISSTTRDSNNIYRNIKYLTSSLYSSTYNKEYNNFYYDIINNNIATRNRVITSSPVNIMSLILFNNKYLVTKDKELHGYKLIKEINDYKIYENSNVLPLAYATSNIISEIDFDKYKYPYSSEVLLNNVITDDKTNNKFISNIKEFKYDKKHFDFNDLNYQVHKDYIEIDNDHEVTIKYKLPKKLHNKIIFIRFNNLESPSCSKKDNSIIINGIKNKLTCKEWRYHNGNYLFDYVISDKDLKEINITFEKGNYKINNIETYYLDPAYIENVRNNIDEFKINENKTKGDKIIGNIDVKKDGYFVSSIPYDKGFKIKVDGKVTDYQVVNKTFLGFKIQEGKHDIEIEYTSPLKNIALIISAFGVISFIVVTIIEHKQKI